jgi:hypothetical protein
MTKSKSIDNSSKSTPDIVKGLIMPDLKDWDEPNVALGFLESSDSGPVLTKAKMMALSSPHANKSVRDSTIKTMRKCSKKR